MNFNSTKTIEKPIEKYVILTLKPKIPQRSDTFRRRIFTFLDPTYLSQLKRPLSSTKGPTQNQQKKTLSF
jgi:hypothetical protein